MKRPLIGLVLGTIIINMMSGLIFSTPEDTGKIFEAGFENDGLAPIPDAEWDDLDSYGFFVNATLTSSANIYTRIRGITNRRENSRTDLLHLGVGWKSYEVFRGPFVMALNGGAGIEAYGNFGMSSVQSGWHSSSGINRPINSNYDVQRKLSPLVSAGVRVAHSWAEMLTLRLTHDLTIDTYHTVWAAGITAGGMDISAGFEGYFTSTLSPSLLQLYKMESGYYYNISHCSGRLRYSFNAHPGTGISKGTISFITGDCSTPSVVDMDFGIILGNAPSTSVQFSMPIESDWRFTPLVSFALTGGWTQEEASGNVSPRYTSYTAGIGLSRQLNSVIAVRSSFLAGLSFDQLRSLSQDVSAVVDSRSVIETGLSGELRFVIPEIIGIGIRSEYAIPAIVLHSSRNSFDYRAPLRFQVFLISQ